MGLPAQKKDLKRKKRDLEEVRRKRGWSRDGAVEEIENISRMGSTVDKLFEQMKTVGPATSRFNQVVPSACEKKLPAEKN
jgi:hypothetical protein